jgi:acetyltransferase-like isoleucine patch superfamily enzyme
VNLRIKKEQQRFLAQHGLQISEDVVLRDHFLFEPPARVYHFTTLNGVRLSAFSYVSPFSALHQIEIGRYSSLGDNFQVLSHHPLEWLTTSPVAYEAIFSAPFRSQAYPLAERFDKLLPVKIGNDVWIGSGVKVKGGITIGDGAIVAAGAVVTKDVPPFTVVAGVPAKVIRQRFAPELVARIQALQWWRYDLSHQSWAFDQLESLMDQLEKLIESGELQPYQPDWINVQ